MSRKLASFLFISVFATSGISETMFGQSNTTCIDFLTRHDADGMQASVNDWLNGYFSGRIRETGRNLTIINTLNVPLYDLLLKMCEKDPNLHLNEAADAVYAIIP
jgi:hypothetical protein